MFKGTSSIAFAILVVALASTCYGQIGATCRGTTGPGMITPAHFFDTDRMMGTWYLHTTWVGQAENVEIQERQCMEIDFVRNPEDPLNIAATETFLNVTQNQTLSKTNEIFIDTTLPLQSIWATKVNDIDTQIVWTQTTYDDWSLMYGCRYMEDTYRYEFLLLRVRNPERMLNDAALDVIKTVAQGYGFPPENILPDNNADC